MMKIFVLSCLLVLINVSFAVGQSDEWVDDVFIVRSNDGVIQQPQIDSIMTEFSCTNYDRLGKRAVRFFLPVGSNEESVVDLLSSSLPLGMSSVSLEEKWQTTGQI